MNGHSRHSSFIKKCLEKEIIKKDIYRHNVRDLPCLPCPSEVKNGRDDRLNDPKFKIAVRGVLEFFGLESNVKNFRYIEQKSKIDWLQFYESINNPDWFEQEMTKEIDWKKVDAEQERNRKYEIQKNKRLQVSTG